MSEREWCGGLYVLGSMDDVDGDGDVMVMVDEWIWFNK